MDILVKDIDFASRLVLLEVDGVPTEQNCARLKTYLGHCLEYGITGAVIRHANATDNTLDSVCAELRMSHKADITISAEMPKYADDRRKVLYDCRKVTEGLRRKQTHMEYRLRLKDFQNALNQVSQFVLIVGHSLELESLTLSRARLCLTELTMNSLDHADFSRRKPEIQISLAVRPHELEASYRDNAEPFNIGIGSEVDIAEHIKNCSKRGLGLHMLQKITDELNYKRKGKWNHTTLKLKREKSKIPVEDSK